VPPLADKGGGHFVACIKVPLGAGGNGGLPVMQPRAERVRANLSPPPTIEPS
jgi:hypothetical protein